MKKNYKKLLVFSIVLNLLFVTGMGVLIVKKGGISYLNKRVSLALNKQNFSTSYLTKKSEFDSFQISNKDVVFIGDSITDSCETTEIFNNINVKNRGISGDTTTGVLNRLNNIADGKPKKIFILIGINDLGQNIKPSKILDNYAKIIDTIKSKSPNTVIYVQSVLPINEKMYQDNTANVTNMEIMSLNDGIKKIAKNYNANYLDLYSAFVSDGQMNTKYTFDGLHPNGNGYAIWKQQIEKLVND